MDPNNEALKCKCDYVQRWIDAHEKYFSINLPPAVLPRPKLTQEQYNKTATTHHNGQVKMLLKKFELPQIDVPYRISPIRNITKRNC